MGKYIHAKHKKKTNSIEMASVGLIYTIAFPRN